MSRVRGTGKAVSTAGVCAWEVCTSDRGAGAAPELPDLPGGRLGFRLRGW